MAQAVIPEDGNTERHSAGGDAGWLANLTALTSLHPATQPDGPPPSTRRQDEYTASIQTVR